MLPTVGSTRVLPAVLVALVIAACDNEPAPAPATQSIAARAGAGFKGYPDAKSEDFLEYLDERDFETGGELIDSTAVVEITCGQNDDVCNKGNGGRVFFLVVPEEHAFRVKWDKALEKGSDRGHVVAKLINMDKVPIPSKGIEANTPLYEWVGVTESGDPGIQVFSINGDKVNKALTGSNPRECKPKGGGRRSKSAAKLHPDHDPKDWDCGPPASSATEMSSAKNSSNTPPPGRDRQPDDLWISCSAGCCQANFS
jgi:hypothetical protein